MCKNDGGVIVYETVQLSEKEYRELGGTNRGIALPTEADAERLGRPYFRRESDTRIHGSNPEAVRSDTTIVRRSDKKILGRLVQYWRTGGDIPTGMLAPSSFICPAVKTFERAILVNGGERK